MGKFINFSTYNSNQAILSSGRIIFNAKEDSLFLLSKKDIAMSCVGDLHINVGPLGQSTSKMIVNAPKVQFGLGDTNNSVESVAKADSSVEVINDIIIELNKFLNSLVKAKGLVSGGTATLPTINYASDAFNKALPGIQKKLEKIKSKTTFTS